MNGNDRPAFDPKVFLGLDKVGEGRTIGHYDKNQMVFAQGDLANAIFYLQKGRRWPHCCGSNCSSTAICGRGWTILFRPRRHWPECMTMRNSLKLRGRRQLDSRKPVKGTGIDFRGYVIR